MERLGYNENQLIESILLKLGYDFQSQNQYIMTENQIEDGVEEDWFFDEERYSLSECMDKLQIFEFYKSETKDGRLYVEKMNEIYVIHRLWVGCSDIPEEYQLEIGEKGLRLYVTKKSLDNFIEWLWKNRVGTDLDTTSLVFSEVDNFKTKCQSLN